MAKCNQLTLLPFKGLTQYGGVTDRQTEMHAIANTVRCSALYKTSQYGSVNQSTDRFTITEHGCGQRRQYHSSAMRSIHPVNDESTSRGWRHAIHCYTSATHRVISVRASPAPTTAASALLLLLLHNGQQASASVSWPATVISMSHLAPPVLTDQLRPGRIVKSHCLRSFQLLNIAIALTPSTPAVPNCCCSKGSVPYWSNPPFLIFDIRALRRSGLSAGVPECQKLKMMG